MNQFLFKIKLICNSKKKKLENLVFNFSFKFNRKFCRVLQDKNSLKTNKYSIMRIFVLSKTKNKYFVRKKLL